MLARTLGTFGRLWCRGFQPATIQTIINCTRTTFKKQIISVPGKYINYSIVFRLDVVQIVFEKEITMRMPVSVCIAFFNEPDIGESLRSRGFLVSTDLR